MERRKKKEFEKAMDNFIQTIENDEEVQAVLNDPTQCLAWRDTVLNKLEESDWRKFFTQVMSCSWSGYDSHHWIELVDPYGQKWVWDGSKGSKLKGRTIALFEKAKEMWPDFNHKGVERVVLLGDEES